MHVFKIDGHPPFVALVLIFVGVVERLLVRRRFDRLFNEIAGCWLEIVQRVPPDKSAVQDFDVVMGLRGDQRMASAGLCESPAPVADQNESELRKAISIESDASPQRACPFAAVTQMQRDRIRGLAGHNPDRRAPSLSSVQAQFDDVAVGQLVVVARAPG